MVNSAAQITKVKNGIGSQITDLNTLQSSDYINGGMRLAKVSWCTETANNSGRVTMLQFTLASNSSNFLTLN